MSSPIHTSSATSMTPATTPAAFWSVLTGSARDTAMYSNPDFGPTIAESLVTSTLRPAQESCLAPGSDSICTPIDGTCMPDEMMLGILKHLLPKKRAYTIATNGDDLDFCPATLTSLLQTSTKLKYEVLRTTKEYPIHINITSGEGCACRQLENPRAILETSLGKATRLPLWAWKEVVVTFSPSVHPTVAGECKAPLNREDSARIKALAHPQRVRDFKYLELCHSVQCVIRQSQALGSVTGNSSRMQQSRFLTCFRFKFDGSKGVDSFEQQIPVGNSIWDLSSVRGALCLWRWAPVRNRSLDLPRRIDVGVDWDPNGFFQGQIFPSGISERFNHEMTTWWHFQRPRYGRYIWNWDEVDRGYEEVYHDARFFNSALSTYLRPRTLRETVI